MCVYYYYYCLYCIVPVLACAHHEKVMKKKKKKRKKSFTFIDSGEEKENPSGVAVLKSGHCVKSHKRSANNIYISKMRGRRREADTMALARQPEENWRGQAVASCTRPSSREEEEGRAARGLCGISIRAPASIGGNSNIEKSMGRAAKENVLTISHADDDP